MESTVTLTINGKEAIVPSDWNLFRAAASVGIKIPSLCHHPRLPPVGKCGVCVVEVEGDENPFKLACSTKVQDGWVVRTNSFGARSRSAEAVRRVYAHPAVGGKIERRGDESEIMTELLDLTDAAVEDNNNTISMDLSKCVGCTRCVRACSVLQGIDALEETNSTIGPLLSTKDGVKLTESDCVGCGQCAVVCPTGAIKEKDDIDALVQKLRDPSITCVLQTAPSVRVALAEMFKKEPGSISTGKMVAAARACGFKYVFDTNFGADMTIMEEAHEFAYRLQHNGVLPMFTSCCPAWINTVEKRFPQFIPNLSTSHSPMMMLAPVVKTYWAKKMGIDPETIYLGGVFPCTAKKDEIQRKQLNMRNRGKMDQDMTFTTREFARMMKVCDVDWDSLQEEEFDDPHGESTGAAILFGVSGGVMEAALRTAYEAVTKRKLPAIHLDAVRGLTGFKEASIDVDGTIVRVGVVNGLTNAQNILQRLQNDDPYVRGFHFIEVMSCPGGCIAGGGQPTSERYDCLDRRMKSVYKLDDEAQVRCSHDNPSIKRLYSEFIGKPLGHKAHEMLHTTYTDRSKSKVSSVGQGGVPGRGILILYGSQSGATAAHAKNVAADAKKAGVDVRVMACDQYDVSKLDNETNLMIMISTYGDGEFPDNAKKFSHAIGGLKSSALTNLQFGVCGFGSSLYPKFCEAAKRIEIALKTAGASPVCDMVTSDNKIPGGGEDAIDEFSKKCLEAMGASSESLNEPPPARWVVALSLSAGAGAAANARRAAICPPGYHFVHLSESRRVSAAGYPRPVNFFAFDLDGSGIKYEVGDHVDILPRNNSERVTKFLEWYGLSGDTVISCSPSDGQISDLPAAMTVRELFEQYVDIFATCSRKFIQLLARFASDEKERNELNSLLNPEKKQKLSDLLRETQYDEAMRKWPSAVPPIEHIVTVVPRIRPRSYSIASSGKARPTSIELMIVLHQWKTPGGKTGSGLCTSYLFDLDASKRPKIAVRCHTGLLVPPADPRVPIIMAGLGTGVAPFRGFMQEREFLKAQGLRLGPALLYLGCRHQKKGDFVFEDEWKNYLKGSVLSKMVNAFSHDQPHLIFIQDKVCDDPETVYEYLQYPDVHFYYCGPANGIPEEVMEGFRLALVSQGEMQDQQSVAFMQKMHDERRIRLESY